MRGERENTRMYRGYSLGFVSSFNHKPEKQSMMLLLLKPHSIVCVHLSNGCHLPLLIVNFGIFCCDH